MAIHGKDLCPRCKTDISRRLGVITSASVNCSFCGQQVQVTRNAVLNNWQYNSLMWPFFAIWTGMAVTVLFNQDLVVALTRFLPITVDVLVAQVLGAVLCLLPAFVCAIPFALVGRVVGCLVAWQLESEGKGRPILPTAPGAVQELRSQRLRASASGKWRVA